MHNEGTTNSNDGSLLPICQLRPVLSLVAGEERENGGPDTAEVSGQPVSPLRPVRCWPKVTALPLKRHLGTVDETVFAENDLHSIASSMSVSMWGGGGG